MSFFSGFKRGFKSFGLGVSVLINSLLLCFVYFFAVLLSHLLTKGSGKRFMRLKGHSGETYWEGLDLDVKPLEDFYRQF